MTVPESEGTTWPAPGTSVPGQVTTTYEQLELPLTMPEFDDGGSGREYPEG